MKLQLRGNSRQEEPQFFFYAFPPFILHYDYGPFQSAKLLWLAVFTFSSRLSQSTRDGNNTTCLVCSASCSGETPGCVLVS